MKRKLLYLIPFIFFIAFLDEFRRYEREAREKGLGLWKGGGN